MVRWLVGSIPHGGPIQLFLVPAGSHDWYTKGRGMCYPVCALVHIKDLLLLSEWYFIILVLCPMPNNRKIKCVSTSLNKTIPSFT